MTRLEIKFQYSEQRRIAEILSAADRYDKNFAEPESKYSETSEKTAYN